MADWVFWPHFSQMGPPRPHAPLTYKTEGMREVRGQNTAWSLADAIVLIYRPMTKAPRSAGALDSWNWTVTKYTHTPPHDPPLDINKRTGGLCGRGKCLLENLTQCAHSLLKVTSAVKPLA